MKRETPVLSGAPFFSALCAMVRRLCRTFTLRCRILTILLRRSTRCARRIAAKYRRAKPVLPSTQERAARDLVRAPVLMPNLAQLGAHGSHGPQMPPPNAKVKEPPKSPSITGKAKSGITRSMFARPVFLAIFFSLLSSMASFSAQARPRDQVMSSAFGCAAIGSSRLWLDCFYGAAQPVRGELGLQPAPAAQSALALAPRNDGVPAGDMDIRDTVLGGASRCVGVADEHQWLNCYYGAAEPMRARLGLAPSRTYPVMASAMPPANMPAPVPVPGSFQNVASRMASYVFSKYGVFTVTLANGQVWQQIAGDTDHARWNKPAQQYLVRITRGFLGSYNLQVRNNPGLFKVLPVR
jgi:hypothetical protein